MRAAPVRTLLVPIAVFILLCTLGLCGVLYAASQRSADDKNNVRNGIATEIATGLKLQLETTQSATAAVTAYIKQQPSCAGLVTAFPKLAATGWAWSGSGGSGATSSVSARRACAHVHACMAASARALITTCPAAAAGFMRVLRCYGRVVHACIHAVLRLAPVQDVKTTLMAVQAAPAGLLIHFYPSSPTDPVGLDLLGDARRRETTLAAVAADRLTLQVRRANQPAASQKGAWAGWVNLSCPGYSRAAPVA